MSEPNIRRFFPGSNTAAGFVGYFEGLRDAARRTVILKGGPGVGKSTLMQEAGKRFENQGMEVHYFRCSGDPDSLDAVYAPAAGHLILDGTAPHVVDPRFPGARDGILNLGVCLDEQQLAAQAGEIEPLNREIAACFAQAYRYLAAALWVRRDSGAVCAAAWPAEDRKKMLRALEALVPDGPEGNEGHCFAQAVTWKGVLQEVDSILAENTVCLDLPWGFDAGALLFPLWSRAAENGTLRRAYHDPLDADTLAHAEIGGTVFTTAVLPGAKTFAPSLDAALLNREKPRLAFDRAVYDLCLNQAVESLAQAKSRHDALERYYVDAMDYARLDEIKAAFLASLPKE